MKSYTKRRRLSFYLMDNGAYFGIAPHAHDATVYVCWGRNGHITRTLENIMPPLTWDARYIEAGEVPPVVRAYMRAAVLDPYFQCPCQDCITRRQGYMQLKAFELGFDAT